MSQGLEYLKSRLLMAADLPAAAVPYPPYSPDTVTIQVDRVANTDVNNNDMSGKINRGVDLWGTRSLMKIKSNHFANSHKDGFKWKKQGTTSEPHKNAAATRWTSDSSFRADEPSTGLDDLFAAIARSTDSHHNRVGEWASRYIALSAGLGGEMAKQTNIEVLGGFGAQYEPDISKIFAFKTHDTASFTEAYTREGNAAAISEFELRRNSRIESKLHSAGVASDIEAYVYTARFGAGPSHMGTALARTHWAGTEIVFLPMAMVKADDLSVKDAAAFIAHQLNGKGNFTDFVKNRHGKEVPAAQTVVDNPISHAIRQRCNYRELAACSAEILDTLESELEAAKEAHKQTVNKIMRQYGEDTGEGLIEWIIGGAITGGFAGAVTGGPPGALVMGFFGALAGIAAAMTGGALNADEIQEELDAADAEYADAICQAKSNAIASLVECIREHCPDLAEAAEQWAEQQMEIEECGWD